MQLGDVHARADSGLNRRQRPRQKPSSPRDALELAGGFPVRGIHDEESLELGGIHGRLQHGFLEDVNVLAPHLHDFADNGPRAQGSPDRS